MNTKRVAALIMVMLMTAALFCVPVNFVKAAETSTLNRTVNSRTVGDITVNVTAYQGYPYGYTSLNGGYVQDTYIYVSIRNNSYTDAHLVTSPQIQPTYSSAAMTVSTECYTQDLIAADRTSLGTYDIESSGEYNVGGSIVLGPAQNLYCFYRITNRANYDTATSTVVGPALNGVSIYAFTVGNYTGTLPSEPVDLSDVEAYLTDIDQNTDNIESLLTDIKTALSYGGSISGIVPRNYNWYTWSVHSQGTQDSNFECYIKVLELSSFVLSEEMAYTVTNGLYRHDCYVVPVQLRVLTYNRADTALKTSRRLDVNNLLPKASKASLFIYGEEMDLFDKPYFDTTASTTYMNLCMPVKLSLESDGIIPSGVYYDTYTILMIYDEVVNDSFNTSPTFSFNTYSTDLYIDSDVIFPVTEINKNVKQLLDAYNSVNGTGDLSDNSNNLTEDLNNAHTAEQNYFSDNSQALAASGISNPNFEASDRADINSAITGNKNTFGLLWNAIGPWRNVYIYAALLCLVTYLLRHRPWIQSSHPSNDNYKLLR